MNQKQIGNFIAKKRKEKNYTQAQLAEKLNVSNKTISKWENGNCMPDYGIIERLCFELNITVTELLNGEDAEKSKPNDENENRITIFLLRKMKELDKKNNIIFGILIIIAGFIFLLLSLFLSGSAIQNFVSGLFLGLSVVTMIAGIVFTAKTITGK